jgi:hypothetical protein
MPTLLVRLAFWLISSAAAGALSTLVYEMVLHRSGSRWLYLVPITLILVVYLDTATIFIHPRRRNVPRGHAGSDFTAPAYRLGNPADYRTNR